jgi:methionyl-tRNA formyltransferase
VTAAPVRTVFLGSGAFGLPALETLLAAPSVDLVAVVTAPPRPTGRAARLTPTVIDTAAREHDLTVLTPERLRDPAAIEAVLAQGAGLLVLADYGRLVPAALLDPQHGALNVHPSLLPRHRGATPIPAAILAGDTETGVSLMRMDAGLDTGPLIAQARIGLDGTELTPELETRLAGLGADLLSEHLEPWLAGAIDAQPQDEAGATLTRPFRREDGRLDPTRPAAELERQVRAQQPWPGTFIETAAGRLAVLAAAVDERGASASGARAGATGAGAGTSGRDAGDAGAPGPGTFDAEGLWTGAGRLRLLQVQPAGGRPMAWADFLRGRPSIIGSSIVS